jgi:hypothetical protein
MEPLWGQYLDGEYRFVFYPLEMSPGPENMLGWRGMMNEPTCQ